MKFIELTNGCGDKFLFDIDSGWEIYDNGDNPAIWSNNKEGRNLDAQEPYAVIRAQLFESVPAAVLSTQEQACPSN